MVIGATEVTTLSFSPEVLFATVLVALGAVMFALVLLPREPIVLHAVEVGLFARGLAAAEFVVVSIVLLLTCAFTGNAPLTTIAVIAKATATV